MVKIALVLLISLSRTSSSFIFPNSWLILWDLGLLEEAPVTCSARSSLGVGEGNSSCFAATCFVRSTPYSSSSLESVYGRLRIFLPCAGASSFSIILLKSRFFLSFLKAGESWSTAIGEMDLLLLFPLLGVEDLFEGEFFLSSHCNYVSKSF